MRYNLPSAPSPEDIPVCTGCNLGDPETERFVSPTRGFAMGFDQLKVTPDEKVGTPLVEVSLRARRDVTLDVNGKPQMYRGVILPAVCEPLRHLDLSPEAWEYIREKGCPGPEPGRKRYMLFGRQAVKCELLRLLQSSALER